MSAFLRFLLFATCFVVCPFANAQEKTTLKLLSGETITGTAGAVKDGSLSFITDYGPVRIPVGKISAESKKELGISGDVDVAALTARIKELEDLVVRLRQENAELRRTSAPPSTPQPLVSRGTSGGSVTPAPAASGMQYRISSTGKRHNSRCRYYGSKGRACSANEGVACKICGG